jgi:hypothetical protein
MVTEEDRYDTWFWISKIIVSCKNIHHINACENLIESYKRMYNDQVLASKLCDELDFKIQELIELKQKL